MRSSVSYMLSESGREPEMSHPDYQQTSHDHGSLLVLTRGIGPNKSKSLQRVFERIQDVNNICVTDSVQQPRDIWVRYIQDHPVENNDWGDFQTHRRLLGLITVGKFDTQVELNELCRIHESLKVKYTNTLYDSRCILFGPSKKGVVLEETFDDDSLISGSLSLNSGDSADSGITNKQDDAKSAKESNNGEIIADENDTRPLKDRFTTPSNFKSRAIFYEADDPCDDLESNMHEFINGLFWILESKRLEKTREKIDKIALLTAPFEIKDFVGLDMESRNNKKRCMGRASKHLGDLTLQAGLVAESLNLFNAASETLRAIGDSLWLGAAYEGMCSASAILLYPNLRHPKTGNGEIDDVVNNKRRLSNRKSLQIDPETPGSEQNSTTSSVSSSSSITSSVSNGTDSSSSTENANSNNRNSGEVQYPSSILTPDEFVARYRDAIINYSKYKHAGIIETEAALKAARICIEQNQKLNVAMFLQNVLYINLNMSEQERVRRFEVLTEMYKVIGYNRKAAFCQRLAAWRHVAQSNPNPNWNASYKLMLESFPGHKLSLEPTEVLTKNIGWPVLQIDLLQQLVGAARRLGQSALATRHMTFLLQTMWRHLTPTEQREMALQLQNLSAQCEGSPVALNLENGTTIPPANLTDLPYCHSLQLKELPPSARSHKLAITKTDFGPFIFTPINFGSMDRRARGSRRANKNERNCSFDWIQHDLCEVTLQLANPLPFELPVSDMRLLTDGIVFESLPQTIILQPNHTTTVTLQGTPLEVGELIVRGYSTHTLGVKSNCELKDMRDRQFPQEFAINVIPALPRLQIQTSTSLSPSTFTPSASSSDVVASASLTMYNGETQEITVTLKNTSKVPIEHLDCKITSSIEPTLLKRIFSFSPEDLQAKLPLLPDQSAEFVVTVFGEADFVGPVSLPANSMNDGPQSLPIHSNTLSVFNSDPSRTSSPTSTPRRTELTSSFRSTHSGQSSLNTMSLNTITGNVPRQIEAQLRFSYSGSAALKAGFCRECSTNLHLELIPSAQISNWDVLPAETGSQFYLVLDVTNLTVQEMTLNYTDNKTILIEAKESCRVPVPVERCDLEKILAEHKEQNEERITQMMQNGLSEVDLPEKLCATHISNAVNLKWTLSGADVTGVATLKGISLSHHMLDLITLAPLQWDVSINNQSVAPQNEVTCVVGQSVPLAIQICNVSSSTLEQLTLSIQFFQDYQNNMQNYRLETRVIMSGPNFIEIPHLQQNSKASYECSLIFFTPGRFKADIQCRSASSTSASHTAVPLIMGAFAANNSASNSATHVWRFIPNIEVTVVLEQ
ncbi:protein brunelleschi [Culicoides brevitarsis]|uniref:protein brunelleschi n=1 Tax=Culicoides brevitarsis TaxID=469753 RepID=UPI00307B9378